jgi:RNA polymerase I-specific transcription initiation factor RRN3
MDDWSDKSLELVKEEVRVGIQRHLALGEQKDDTQYARLLQLIGQDAFSGDAPSTKLLKRYIMALSTHIGGLGECSKLVLAALDLSWLGRDDEFVEVYVKFLVILASTHAKFISPMLDKVVAHFERLPASSGRLPGEEPVSRATMFERLHEFIQTLVRRVPSASSVLVRMLKNQFPNDLATAKGHVQYQRHILRLVGELPELKSEMMALIVQRLVEIDVQIQQDIDELEDEEEDKLIPRARVDDDNADADDSDDSDIESVSESELTTTDEEQRLRELRLKVAKMDATQDLMFSYYAPSFTPDSTPYNNNAYKELLSHFDNFIMPNRSRHTQFLLFHFAQSSSAYARHFTTHCLKIACDRNIATNVRLTACAYVASFTARASHVTTKLVREITTTLCVYLDDMRHTYEPSCRGPDRKAYNIYYATAQALFYIFCFRWRDLIEEPTSLDSDDEGLSAEDILAEGRDLNWIAGLKDTLNKNMHSIMNPLKVCSSPIVGEFAKISNHLRFLYVFSLLERNKRIRLGQMSAYSPHSGGIDIGRRETAWDRKTGDAHHQLEPYFPFDPYHLPQSKKWLDGEYNTWKLPRGMKQDDDESEDDADDSEDEYDSDGESIPEDLTREPTGMMAADAIPISSC